MATEVDFSDTCLAAMMRDPAHLLKVVSETVRGSTVHKVRYLCGDTWQPVRIMVRSAEILFYETKGFLFLTVSVPEAADTWMRQYTQHLRTCMNQPGMVSPASTCSIRIILKGPYGSDRLNATSMTPADDNGQLLKSTIAEVYPIGTRVDVMIDISDINAVNGRYYHQCEGVRFTMVGCEAWGSAPLPPSVAAPEPEPVATRPVVKRLPKRERMSRATFAAGCPFVWQEIIKYLKNDTVRLVGQACAFGKIRGTEALGAAVKAEMDDRKAIAKQYGLRVDSFMYPGQALYIARMRFLEQSSDVIDDSTNQQRIIYDELRGDVVKAVRHYDMHHSIDARRYIVRTLNNYRVIGAITKRVAIAKLLDETMNPMRARAQGDDVEKRMVDAMRMVNVVFPDDKIDIPAAWLKVKSFKGFDYTDYSATVYDKYTASLKEYRPSTGAIWNGREKVYMR